MTCLQLKTTTTDSVLDDFAQATQELKAAVGAAFVIGESEAVKKRSKGLIPSLKTPRAFVYPENISEIQEILKVCRRFRLPIWPCSIGKNWGYGAATPARDGGITLVLERMNKIVHVDEEMAFAVIEPGVTYRQLHTYLQRHHPKLWIDCTDGPADASVMGNALERGIGETNYGDHFGNICGMEVLLADGSLVRTGGGPLKGYKSWNTYKWGVGPYLEGLFTQSNFGIVTKIGMWLMPEPEYFETCVFELNRDEDLPDMMDALRRLQLNGAIQSKVHVINDVISFAIVDDDPRELLQGQPFLSHDRKVELRRQWNIAPWCFAAGLYGTKHQVKANKRLIRKELGPCGRLDFVNERKNQCLRLAIPWLKKAQQYSLTNTFTEFITLKTLGKPLKLLETIPHVHAIEKGYPSDFFVKHVYYKSRHPKPADDDFDPVRDNCGLISIGPMVPLNGREASRFLDLCEPLFHEYGFDMSAALMVANPRTVVMLMQIFYDKSDADETQRAQALYDQLGKITHEAGYQQYRTTTAFMDRILKPAPEFKELCDRLKDAVDPQRILAPGKYGVGEFLS